MSDLISIASVVALVALAVFVHRVAKRTPPRTLQDMGDGW